MAARYTVTREELAPSINFLAALFAYTSSKLQQITAQNILLTLLNAIITIGSILLIHYAPSSLSPTLESSKPLIPTTLSTIPNSISSCKSQSALSSLKHLQTTSCLTSSVSPEFYLTTVVRKPASSSLSSFALFSNYTLASKTTN